PIAVVFYEKYSSLENLKKELENQTENIQCMVSTAGLHNEIEFGKAQNPALWDYADGVDTVDFLLKLP
ncbi:MAG TPA: acyl-CoA reductase, partial [Aequorivita sp.]|nr:acyl-CoA reductase [Aequorivita sp.]